MPAHRTAPSIALIVQWPNSVAEPAAQHLARRLADCKLNATWAVEEPTQIAALRAANHTRRPIDLALLISGAGAVVEAIDRGLTRFRVAGEEIASVSVAAELPRGVAERRLRQAGVRAVVSPSIRSERSIVTALPFGLWNLAPHIAAPAPRRWFGLFGRASGDILKLVGTTPALAAIDMARAGAPGSRGWTAIDRLIEEVAESSARGIVTITSIADIAAELSDSTATRPQRSILKMAA
jgi:hypothetical protein